MNREGPGKIGYLDFVWNPVAGCTNGCPWCWARRQAKRQKHNCLKCYNFEPHLHPERLDEPLRTREPSVIGVAFMGDLFDPEINGEMLARCFEVMQACPRHTFVVLTKQAKRMRAECETLFENWFVRFPDGILPNVVLGVSVEDQASADRLIPELLKCPAAMRIVSIEPMRGPVNLAHLRTGPDQPMEGFADTTWHPCGDALRKWKPPADWRPGIDIGPSWTGLDGVILGGQTGPGAVAMDPNWVREVRDQCAGAGVPFFFKQWGEWHPVSEYNFSTEMWRHGMIRVGRKAAGRSLDGRTHDEVPWTAGLRREA